MDPKTATQLDEIDLLKHQNFALRKKALDGEGSALAAAIWAKYRADGENLQINQDTGEIVRVKDSPTAP